MRPTANLLDSTADKKIEVDHSGIGEVPVLRSIATVIAGLAERRGYKVLADVYIGAAGSGPRSNRLAALLNNCSNKPSILSSASRLKKAANSRERLSM